MENHSAWVVYCNSCNHPMDDEHFHCSVCDGGDYDLCPSCVDSGVHCPGSGHWMVKRFVKNGCVVNSTTQRIPPKFKVELEPRPQPQPEEPKEVPGAFTDEKQSVYSQEPTRTCNSCVNSKSSRPASSPSSSLTLQFYPRRTSSHAPPAKTTIFALSAMSATSTVITQATPSRPLRQRLFYLPWHTLSAHQAGTLATLPFAMAAISSSTASVTSA
jgi:hypothetical protein